MVHGLRKAAPVAIVQSPKGLRLVDSMLALHKQLASAKSDSQRGAVQRQIDATDAQIDRLVYALYSLSADEIAIVEGAGK
jgi:adenine-specific DNA-methyltransferase